ncbi:hypothetical protein PC118_g7373 [Phytophthora cactorum]|uniref:Uncharacterized protein n=1 Tax=Phytophthora cactorum TaxID=29920 RepID=A0A8T1G6E4_9STRA|nr:hypothetical protein PC118_g7373 [Phytophthora cactorum]KAG3075310.1 hypothetical protein PC121_g8043 [Phytophthora cactorum]
MLWYQAVEYFSAEEDIEFDNLYPKYEPDFGSLQTRDGYKPPWRLLRSNTDTSRIVSRFLTPTPTIFG